MRNLRIFRTLFLIVGVFLFVTGLVVMICSNTNIGVLLATLLGVFLILAGVFYERFMNTPRPLVRCIRYIFCIGAAVWLMFSVFLGIYGHINTVRYDEEVLIVLGCGVNGDTPSKTLRLRLDKAIDYIEMNPDVKILVSGGKGPQEDISEADAMSIYLMNNGVNPRNIIKENTSTSTYENFKNSKKLLESRMDNDDYTCAVVTSDFHIFRAERIAKRLGFNVSILGAYSEWYIAPINYIREALAVAKYIVFKR